jgi:hypothetical protein
MFGTITGMDSPEHERRHVVEYMEAEARDETVEHAEKITAERVYGEEYSVWDVHTDEARWWVIGPGMNLYSQKRFKSMDEVLSFHIGLIARVMARQARKAPDRPEPRLERTRRQWEQAAEAQEAADEAEEFQAVGARCRETLLSFVHAMGTEALLPETETPPVASDFIHWSEKIANAVAPGESADELRSYLKAISKSTWKYVSWLTHAKNATRTEGDIAVQMVAHFLLLFEEAIERKERGGPERCPSCSSYRVVGDEVFDFENETVTRRRLCQACGWSEEYEPEPLGPPPPPPREPPEGECVIAD